MRFEYLRYFYKIAGIIDDVREIFKEKYPSEPPGKIFNIAEQWRRKNNITEILDRESLKASLPDNINDVLKNSEIEDLRKSLKLAGLPEESVNLLNKEGLSWFKERYVDKTRKEIIHPILEALNPVLFYLANKDSIVNFLSDLEVSDHLNINQSDVLLNLSLDDIIKLNSAFRSSKEGNQKQTSIDTTNVIPNEKEFIAKVGNWNVWLPHTQETSAKIAGYHPITKEPLTTWCTARTKGSNLFYNYAGKVDPSHFGYSRSSLDRAPDLYLYYIIKDNPSTNIDWLSIGVLNGGNKIEPIFNGEDGGVTIDRENKSLTKDNFYRIVGGEVADKILNIIIEKTKEYGENHPAIESIRDLITDVSKFKRALLTKGAGEERTHFAAKVLDLGEEIFQNKEIFSLCVEANPYYFFKNIVPNYKDKISDDVLQTALKFYAKKIPYQFLTEMVPNYKDKISDDVLQIALKSCAEKDLNYFLTDIVPKYKDKISDDALQIVLKSYAEEKPYYFFKYIVPKYKDKISDDALQYALKSCAETNPYYFFENIVPKYKDKISDDTLQYALKSCAEENPYDFFKDIFPNYKDKISDDALQIVLKSYAERDPYDFLTKIVPSYKDKISDDALQYAFKCYVERDPYYFFENIVPNYKDKISDDALQIALKSYAETNPYYFLKDIVPNYKDKISDDALHIALKSCAEQDPYHFLAHIVPKYKDKISDDVLQIAKSRINNRFASTHSSSITASKIKVLKTYLIKSGFKKEAEELLKIM